MPRSLTRVAAFELVRRALVRRGARSRQIPLAGETVHFFEQPGAAERRVFLLVHGLGGSSLTWGRCLRRLSPQAARVLALDLPGTGFSPPSVKGTLSADELVELIATFIRQEVRSPVVLVGNSLGGAMVTRLAARSPDLVEALVLVAPAGARVSPERFEEMLRLQRVATLADARRVLGRLFHRKTHLLPWLFAAGMRDSLTTPQARRLVEEASRIQGLEEHELSGLEPPVLLLWGKAERVLAPEGIAFFRAHLPPSATIEEVDGFGHVPQLERPNELCERILRFVSTAKQARSCA